MQVFYHPRFARQYEQLAAAAEDDETTLEVFGEVSALIRALEDFGHDIEGEQSDNASHRVVSSRYELFTLRRTPPTTFTPYAVGRPVIRDKTRSTRPRNESCQITPRTNRPPIGQSPCRS